MEKLTADPQEINKLTHSLVWLRKRYFTIAKEYDFAISREIAVARAVEFLPVSEWIFNAPGLQLHQAAYQKVAEQLDALFLEHLPRDCTHLITDYLISAPILKFGKKQDPSECILDIQSPKRLPKLGCR